MPPIAGFGTVAQAAPIARSGADPVRPSLPDAALVGSASWRRERCAVENGTGRGITFAVEVSEATDAAQRSTIENFGRPDPQCPKHMVYGPCGGVRENGDCELGDRRCPFVDRALIRWDGPHAESNDWRPFGTDGTGIVIDLRVRPFDVGSIDEVTRRLAGSCDAVLIGEHHARPDFPPTFIAAAVNEAGGRPWVTLTCRDRNRVVLEAEIEALRGRRRRRRPLRHR